MTPKRFVRKGRKFVPTAAGGQSAKSAPTQSQPSSHPEATEGWTFLLESGRDFDQTRLDNWKDELNNLLVFTGLFSAVVTAFVVESYQSLQADPAAISNQLLSQISLQLSSLTLSPGFVNATSALPSPEPASAPFSPDNVDVTVNLLWFLSLTFSLVAAFFAIAAQQWLRSLSLPRHLSVWNAVRLQQCHRRDMSFCQVPNIIALLPVLLQIAVILFLVGLWFFLHELNERITIAYSVIALLPFVLYAVSLFLPLFWPECPFKSPLVPSAAFVFQWIVLLLFVLAMVVVILPSLMLARLGTGLLVFCGQYCELGYPHQHVRWRLFTLVSRFELHLRNMYALLFKQMGDFWTDLELKHLQRTDTPKLVNRDFGEALATAPHFVPRKELKRLRQCYLSLSSAQRTHCALTWTAMHLGYSGEEDITESGSWSLMDQKFVQKVDEYLGSSFKNLLLESLPEELLPESSILRRDLFPESLREESLREDPAERDWIREVPNITRILILLNRLVKLGDRELGGILIPLLMKICQAQKIEVTGFWSSSRINGMNIPTVCLFECSQESSFSFSRDQALGLLRLAETRADYFTNLHQFVELEYITVNMHDLVLGSFSVGLLALAEQPETDWDDNLAAIVNRTFATFTMYVKEKRDGIRFTGQVAEENAGKRLIITPKAMKSVAESLQKLSGRSSIQSQRAALVEALGEVCDHEPAFKDSSNILADGRHVSSAAQPTGRRPLATMFRMSSPRGSLNGAGSWGGSAEITERSREGQQAV